MNRSAAIVCFLGLTLAACGGGGSSNGDGDGGNTPPAQRATNAACVASGIDDTNTRAFPAISFSSAITGLVQAPGRNDYWYVTTQSGVVARFANESTVAVYTILSGAPTVSNTSLENGMLALALHPDFANNGYVYLSYTTGISNTDQISHVTRYTLIDTALTNPVEIISLQRPDPLHNGGQIGFGPDGYLYASFGDGGGIHDWFGNAQNPLTFHAKLLRIDVDGGTPYRVPADNPFVGNSNYLPEIFALGFRNPWRWSFDRLTGDIWLGDVGEALWEEINKVQAGANYGWPIADGNHCYGYEGESCSTAGLTPPVWEYSHEHGCAVSGGFVYRGSALPELYGYYVYGDYCARGVKGFAVDDPSTHREIASAPYWGVSTFGQDNDGEILIGTVNGELHRLASSSSTAPAVPRMLSQHPCVASTAKLQLVEGVVPYSVNNELWSDNTEKSRFVALPDGQAITVNESDGDMLFPVGSVLIKHFAYRNMPVETRFLMHHASGWAGYSYKWNAEGNDAALSTAPDLRVFDDGHIHIFPGSPQCFECHTSAANITLGVETAQLNRNQAGLLFGAHRDATNQLDIWQQAGMFTDTLSASSRDRILPAIDDTSASVAERARAYLHSNCSGCHRPGGFPSHIDFRYDTPLSQTGVCNVDPRAGDLGIPGAKLLLPTDISRSLIYQRIKRVGPDRMPPLPPVNVDAQALEVIQAWIESLSSCAD